MLRHTNKEGPQTRPNRPTKPRHRPSDIKTHQAVYQRRSVGNSAKGGLADPLWKVFPLSFGGKTDPILSMAVWHVSIQGDGGNRPLKL